MPALNIILDAEGCWPDISRRLQDKSATWDECKSLSVARLTGGMQSGADSVAIRLDMNDGKTHVVQTSMALFLAAADAFRARQQFEAAQAGDKPAGG